MWSMCTMLLLVLEQLDLAVLLLSDVSVSHLPVVDVVLVVEVVEDIVNDVVVVVVVVDAEDDDVVVVVIDVV